MDRYAELKKIPNQPAARMLASTGTKLETQFDAPASASVEVVLKELDAKDAWIDMLRALPIFLPPREAVWWACLAARDLVGEGEENTTHCLRASEAWVFKPTDENRQKVRIALEAADNDDDTALVATAALYAPGNMGEGDLAEYPAPPAAVCACSFGINMKSCTQAEDFDSQMQLLIDRALDIARGGSGKNVGSQASDEKGEK